MLLDVNSIVQYLIQIKNGMKTHVNVNVKMIIINDQCKEGYSRSPSTCIWENSTYLTSIAGNSVTEIIIVMDFVSRKKTNIRSTASIRYHSEKVRDSYILHTVLLVIILLLIIFIICYFYAKEKGEYKITNFKKFVLKSVRVIISMT